MIGLLVGIILQVNLLNLGANSLESVGGVHMPNLSYFTPDAEEILIDNSRLKNDRIFTGCAARDRVFVVIPVIVLSADLPNAIRHHPLKLTENCVARDSGFRIGNFIHIDLGKVKGAQNKIRVKFGTLLKKVLTDFPYYARALPVVRDLDVVINTHIMKRFWQADSSRTIDDDLSWIGKRELNHWLKKQERFIQTNERLDIFCRSIGRSLGDIELSDELLNLPCGIRSHLIERVSGDVGLPANSKRLNYRGGEQATSKNCYPEIRREFRCGGVHPSLINAFVIVGGGGFGFFFILGWGLQILRRRQAGEIAITVSGAFLGIGIVGLLVAWTCTAG